MSAYALIAAPDAEDTAKYRSLVTEAGLDAVEVRDGEAARRILKERGAPALFITELSLPRADGFALLGDLRKVAGADTSPALVISAFPEIRATASMLSEQLGIHEVLSTRESVSELRRAIQDSLDHAVVVSRPHVKTPPGSPQEAAMGEQARLAKIARMEIVDDLPPDETLQRLVADVARAFGVPIALVSLILEDRQWFKAYYGLEGKALEARGTPREMSFCRHVVESDGTRPLVVPDASIHPYFASNPLVQQGLVRSYAGAPLVTPEGHVLGTLCIIDNKPLNIGPDEVDALVSLARRVAGELEARWSARRTCEGGDSATLALMEAICGSVESGILVLDQDRRIVLANKALGQIFGMNEDQILSMSREEFILRCSVNADDPQLFLRRMRVFPEGPFSAREHFEVARPKRRLLRWVAKPIHLPSGLGQLEIFDDLTGE